MLQTKTNRQVVNEKLVYVHRITRRDRIKLWVSRIFIWFFIAVILFPVLFVLGASLAKGDAFFTGSIFPKKLSFENYVKVINETDFLIWMKNSMIVCTSVALIQLLMSATSAYAFSRMKFKGRKKGLMFLLIIQIFPSMMAISAILAVAYKFELMDKLWALILVLASGSAYNIWLLKGHIDGIPRELDEAAMVDGASHWQVFWKIIMPLSRPMMSVIFLFCFIGVYSEFALTSALIKDSTTYTVAIGLKTFIDNQFSAHWTQYSAAAIMASIPLMIVFVSLQKFIAKGLISGAVKG